MKKYLFPLLFIFSNAIAQEKMQSNFQNPPIDARPKALWDWVNGNFSYPQIAHELQKAKEVGMGGFDIWDVGTVFSEKNKAKEGLPFLSSQSADAIAFAIREAQKYNLEMGLITSSSWNAGGDWMNTGDASKGIFKSDTIIRGDDDINMLLPMPVLPALVGGMMSGPSNFQYHPQHENIYVVAIEQNSKKEINLTSMVSPNGKLIWKAPKGTWKIHRYIYGTTGASLQVPSPKSFALMMDHFSAETQEKNMSYILDKLTSRLGNDLGKTALKYLYIDSYEVSGSIWSPLFPQEFQKRRGYNVIPLIPALFDSTYISADSLARFRYDVAMTFSDMIIENHYLKGDKMCQKYGIGYAAEAAGPGPPVHNCPFESLRSSGVVNNARGEFWSNRKSNLPDTLPDGDYKLDMIKGVASAVHIYGKKYVEAESFSTTDTYKENFNDLKRVLDNAFTWGLNRVVFHTYQHAPPENGNPGYNYPFGIVFGAFQPWWHLSRGFNDYIARCSYMLQQGNFHADALYFYGDKAPNFVKENTIARIVGNGYDYDAINAEILIDKLDCKNGLLTLPHGQTYKVLILPDSDKMSLPVLKKIEQLVKKGAIVIGSKPTQVHTMNDFLNQEKQLKTTSNLLWGKINNNSITSNNYGLGKIISGQSVPKVLTDMGIAKDFAIKTNSKNSNIRFIHRKGSKGEDIYFISNQSSDANRFDATFRSNLQNIELWNPIDGKTTKVNYGIRNKSTSTIPLELEGYQSIFVIFSTATTPSVLASSLTLDNQKVFPIDDKNNISMTALGIFAKTTSGAVSNFTQSKSTIKLDSNWSLRFARYMTSTPYVELNKLVSWTTLKEKSLQYYSGEATYSNSFNIEKNQLNKNTSSYLQLDSVQNMAQVWLNGVSLGYMWCKPYQVDLTKYLREGENNLVINVANCLNNRQVGDARDKDARPFTYSNILNGDCAWCTPWDKVTLAPAGLIGEAKITFVTVENK